MLTEVSIPVRFFLVFMILVTSQIILAGHCAIILHIFVQGGDLKRLNSSATERTVALQIWDCPLLEKHLYPFLKVATETGDWLCPDSYFFMDSVFICLSYSQTCESRMEGSS